MGMPLFLRYSSDIVFFGACRGASLFSQPATQQVPPIHFQDVAQRAGLRFVLENNPTPRKHMIETMPGGVAAFDYNGDGLTDIFFTNGASIPSLEKDSPKFFNRLYRNDGGMKFTDVTSETGVAGADYSFGAAPAGAKQDSVVALFV